MVGFFNIFNFILGKIILNYILSLLFEFKKR